MKGKIFLVFLAVVAFFALVMVGLWMALMREPVAVIENGKVYAISDSKLVDYPTKRGMTRMRKFDFTERGEIKSILVPLADSAGFSIVRENPQLPPGTLRKSRVKAEILEIEGERYGGYEVTVFEYNLKHKEPQSFVPTYKPPSK